MIDFFRNLEERLLRTEVRRSPDEAGKLLASDFIEFGSSGAVYSRQQILDTHRARPSRRQGQGRQIRPQAVPHAAPVERGPQPARRRRNAAERRPLLRQSEYDFEAGMIWSAARLELMR